MSAMVASYISPKAKKGVPSGIEGRGLIAQAPITAGEVVAVKGGHLVDGATLAALPADLQESEIQVSEGLHLVAVTDEEYEGVMLFLNHSCEPNVGFAGNIVLVAMRDIAIGEGLTTDYALFDTSPGPMECHCGTRSCRATVTGSDWQRPELQARYVGYFSSYLARRIVAMWMEGGSGPDRHLVLEPYRAATTVSGPGRCRHCARMEYRMATPQDIAAIALLHAESWQHNYRGAFSDAFLDGEVMADRLAVWTARLTHPRSEQYTTVAEADGVVVGFSHTVLDDDPTWGALLDNLHVAHDRKGQGIGTRLMAEAAQVVVERAPSSGLFLLVLEQNTAAQAFYEARGGRRVGAETSDAPGGGTIVGLRYAWPEPLVLLAP